MPLTLEETFDICLNNRYTIVYGNLGRKNHLISKYLAKHPNLETLVFSKYYSFPESDNVHVNGPLKKCDLLIYIEPKHPVKIVDYAFRIMVFTSNFAFPEESKEFLKIIYYDSRDMNHEIQTSKRLMDLQMASVYHRNVEVVKNQIDFVQVKTLSNRTNSDYVYAPDKPVPEFSERTYVVIDLTKCLEIMEMLLYLLDAYDVLKANVDRVERWVVCFPEKTEKRFRVFEQGFIDSAMCNKNDKEKLRVFKTTPFMRTNNRKLPLSEKLNSVPFHFFYGSKIFAPLDVESACLINIHHDVESVQNRLYIKLR
jgi:hypothetical protein